MSSNLRNPQLQALADRVEAARQQARRVVSGLTDEQLGWQAGPGRWSVGQCLEHLLISSERLAPDVRRQLATLRARGERPTYEGWKRGFRGGFLIRSIDPATGRRKLKTGRVFEPGPAARPDVLAAFERDLDGLQQMLRDADGLDLTKARVTSPMTRLITYHIGDALTILVVHLPRHVDQAERVKAEPGFPKA